MNDVWEQAVQRPYAAPELTGVAQGSGDLQQQLRWPRPLFLLQQRRLVKGKDVRGGGSGCRRVSRDLGGTLAKFGALALPTRPSVGGESNWGRSARARLLSALAESALLGFRL